MEEESSQLVFGDLIKRPFAEVSQLPNGSEVSFMRPLRHNAEMEILAHAFLQRPIEVRRMRETPFGLRCYSRGLNLPCLASHADGQLSHSVTIVFG